MQQPVGQRIFFFIFKEIQQIEHKIMGWFAECGLKKLGHRRPAVARYLTSLILSSSADLRTLHDGAARKQCTVFQWGVNAPEIKVGFDLSSSAFQGSADIKQWAEFVSAISSFFSLNCTTIWCGMNVNEFRVRRATLFSAVSQMEMDLNVYRHWVSAASLRCYTATSDLLVI